MDSLDAVELVMAIEEAFDVTIPDENAEALQTPSDVIAWLLPQVCNRAPNEIAARELKAIAQRENRPDLLGSGQPWRREQVAAVIRKIIVDQTGTTRFEEDSTFRGDILS